MAEVQQGDTIMHYSNRTVQAISVAATGAIDTRRPGDLPPDLWEQEGRMVRASYLDIKPPVDRDEIPLDWRRLELQDGPFQRDQKVKQGYLFPLSESFVQQFIDMFGVRFDKDALSAAALPPEVRDGAVDLLRELIGQPLQTVTGRTNTILEVRPPNVWVATDRSTTGQPVPIDWVSTALDELSQHGSVTIHPDYVGHGSAFIGAVLTTIPGTRVDGSPPVITIGPQTTTPATVIAESSGEPSSPETGSTFQGDLNRVGTSRQRGEQKPLRDTLLGSAAEAQCALCGETYPARFLWASHIKKRTICSDDEQRDLQHIAMLACLFGCDALFEAGYLAVDDNGFVMVTKDVDHATSIGRRLAHLSGRPVSAFTSGSAPYFAWHRSNTFRS
jgi:hypothetical protein